MPTMVKDIPDSEGPPPPELQRTSKKLLDQAKHQVSQRVVCPMYPLCPSSQRNTEKQVVRVVGSGCEICEIICHEFGSEPELDTPGNARYAASTRRTICWRIDRACGTLHPSHPTSERSRRPETMVNQA